MTDFSVTVTTPVPHQRVADMFIGAFESGGYMPWLHEAHPIVTPEYDKDGIWYSNAGFWAGDFLVELRFDDPDKPEGNSEGCKQIGPAQVQAGLQWMATHQADHFSDMMQEQDDVDTHDVFLQSILFQEVIYG